MRGIKAILWSLLLAGVPFSAAPETPVQPDPYGLIRQELLRDALAAREKHKSEIADDTASIVIVDYSQHSKEKRLYVVNLETGVVESYRATHGRGSDKDHDGFLDAFSDKPGSSASPGGAYVTAEEYQGKHGRSMRLDGLDPSTRNARKRAIVIHAAEYAEPEMIRKYGKLGRSNGCIVFSQADLKTFFETVPRGTLIYVGK
jgi:hypothetical protein